MNRDEAMKEAKGRPLLDIIGRLFDVDVSRPGNIQCIRHDTHHNNNDGNPSMTYYPEDNTVYCHGCGDGKRWDIGDVVAIYDGLDPKSISKNDKAVQKQIWDSVYEVLGIPIDGEAASRSTSRPVQAKQPTPPAKKQPKAPEKPPRDFSALLAQAHKDLLDPQNEDAMKYLAERGITMDMIERFNLGFSRHFQHPDRERSNYGPRIIIPTGDGKDSFQARSILGDAKSKYVKARDGLFNAAVLYDADRPIFIVEGVFDCMAILQAGGAALALGSRATSKLLEAVEERKPTQPLIIAYDNDRDNAGDISQGRINDAEALEKALNDLGVVCFNLHNKTAQALDKQRKPNDVTAFYHTYKDANEALMNADGFDFPQAVKDTEVAALKAITPEDVTPEDMEEARGICGPDAWEAMTLQDRFDYVRGRRSYLEEIGAGVHLMGFLDGINKQADTPATPTGFKLLDQSLGGGLYEGLYSLGAITSVGKTALIMQMADQIAQAGKDVLIISMEMARHELYARSISRHTFIKARAMGKVHLAKDNRDITSSSRYQYYDKEAVKLIGEAVKEYVGYARPHIFIKEGLGDIGAGQIADMVKQHREYTGATPVVIVDYLQILAPYSKDYIHATDKQNTDKNVLELKRLSRDVKTPVVVVSSFNRMSYKKAVTLESFKESGAVEYTSDVLIGMQLKGAGAKTFNPEAEKGKNPRAVELVILKNRNGTVGDKIVMDHYPRFHFLEETEAKHYGQWKQEDAARADDEEDDDDLASEGQDMAVVKRVKG